MVCGCTGDGWKEDLRVLWISMIRLAANAEKIGRGSMVL